GVEEARADLLAAVAQARAGFGLRQGMAGIADPHAAAMAVVAAEAGMVAVAGRARRRWGRVGATEAQLRGAAAGGGVALRGGGGRGGCAGRSGLRAGMHEAGARAAHRTVVVRPAGRDPARIAFAVVAGVAAAVVADALVHRPGRVHHDDRLR